LTREIPSRACFPRVVRSSRALAHRWHIARTTNVRTLLAHDDLTGIQVDGTDDLVGRNRLAESDLTLACHLPELRLVRDDGGVAVHLNSAAWVHDLVDPGPGAARVLLVDVRIVLTPVVL